MNLSTPFPSGTQQRFVSPMLMMMRVNERGNWASAATELWAHEENKQAKLIGRIMMEDQGAIFFYVKHETSINPPNYIVRFVLKVWWCHPPFWIGLMRNHGVLENPYFHEYRGFIKSSFAKRVKILCLTVQYVNSTFVYCILEWVYNKRTIFKSGFYNRFVCPHLCVCAEFQNNF